MTKQRSCLSAFLACVAALSAQSRADIVPVTTIDPSGGAAIKYENVHWSTATPTAGFQAFSAATGTFTATTKADMLKKSNVKVLNFEAAQGFETAGAALATNGTVFSSSSSISPFATAAAITSVSLGSYNIGTEYRGYDTTANVLGAKVNGSGIFLVGDRTAGDTMVSGTQGLVGGPTSGIGQGILLTFDSNLSAFSCVLNCGNTSNGVIYIVSFLNSADQVVGRYGLAVASNAPTYVGVTSSAAEIQKVWIGQLQQTPSIVVDDVAFVAVPEPSALGLVPGGALALVLWSRNGKIEMRP